MCTDGPGICGGWHVLRKSLRLDQHRDDSARVEAKGTMAQNSEKGRGFAGVACYREIEAGVKP